MVTVNVDCSNPQGTKIRNFDAYIRHDCNPHAARSLARTHACPICRVQWVRETASRWSTDHANKSEIVSITVRHADGTFETLVR